MLGARSGIALAIVTRMATYINDVMLGALALAVFFLVASPRGDGMAVVAVDRFELST